MFLCRLLLIGFELLSQSGIMSVADGRIEQRPWFGATDSGLDPHCHKVIVVSIFAPRVVVFSTGRVAAYASQYRHGLLEILACKVALIRNAVRQIVQIATNRSHCERNNVIVMGRNGGSQHARKVENVLQWD